ncbi:MAG: primosomal protein N' [Leptothrix sp. (in: b-proteobacteria)]
MPRHSELAVALDYLSSEPLPPGSLVRVPLGRRIVTGMVWAAPNRPPAPPAADLTDAPLDQVVADGAATSGTVAVSEPRFELKPIAEVLAALPPLAPAWCDLLRFAAAYYQRSVGELALAVLPPELRQIDGTQLARRLKRLLKDLDLLPVPPPKPGRKKKTEVPQEVESEPAAAAELAAPTAPIRPELSPDQARVLAELAAAPLGTTLLWGVTGSGKTEVYLREAERVLAAGRQVLVLVPEINLTPQLEARFKARFPQRRIVAQHSGLTPAQRLQHWLAAHLGHADLMLGTRMAVFASLPRLGLIVVDEEHDPSYKQQEGARYSARDLAVYRGHLESVPVLLGSATPSLETWLNAQPASEAGGLGRYRRLVMPNRIGDGVLPKVRIVDLEREQARHGKKLLFDQVLAPPILAALRERLARGEQSLVLLNRRGYAPVLHCTSCGWKSGCKHCSAWRVFHRSDRTLRCHHCGLTERVPRICPGCGDPDIQPMGRGTERLEELLAELLPGARVQRIDADTTRARGSLESQLASVHAGEVDVLVGTQMVAKGHDFRRVTLVVALNADSALYSSDFRAAERLFALLMQAGGRAGRDAAQADRSELWLQTWHPRHPLYAALRGHDYAAFAASQLQEREVAGLPPYVHLALLRTEARTLEAALAFLDAATRLSDESSNALPDGVMLYPPVPASLQRVADVWRAQMLVEAPRRQALQRFLSQWLPHLQTLNTAEQRVLRWAVDVDPLAI